MAGSDGSIIVDVDIDEKYAAKEIDRLNKKIGKLSSSISQMEKEKSPLMERAQKLGAQLDEARAKYYEVANAEKGTFQDQEIIAMGEAVEYFRKKWEAVNKEIDGYNQKIKIAREKIKTYETKAGELIEETTNGGFDSTKYEKIAESFTAIGNKVKSSLSSAFSSGVNAAKIFGKTLLSTSKNLNVFSKLSSTLNEKMKRLGSTIKSALVFSVIYKGLSLLKEQVGSYLKQNTDLSLALGRLKSALLTAFQPVYDAVVPALTTMANALASVINKIAAFTSALFGTTAANAQESAKALYGQAKATKAAGNAAKEASKPLASFDEINKLTESSGGGGAGGNIEESSTPNFSENLDTTVFSTWGEAFNTFLDNIIKNVLPKLDKALTDFSDRVNTFSIKLLEMFSFPGVETKIETIATNVANSLNKMFSHIDWNILGSALGSGLNSAITFAVTFIQSVDWENVGKSFAETINGLLKSINWKNAGKLLFSGFKIGIETLAGLIIGTDMKDLGKAASDLIIGFFDDMTKTISSIDWHQIGHQIKEFLVNIDWAGIATSVAQAAGSVVAAAMSLVWGFIEDAWNGLINWWYENAMEDGKFTMEGLLQGIWNVVKNIGSWIKTNIFDPFINGFKNAFMIHSPSQVMAGLGTNIIEGLLHGITSGISTIVGGVQSIWTAIKNFWNKNVAKIFQISFWTKKFSTITTALQTKFKDGINAAIELFNKFIAWVNSKMKFSWNAMTVAGKTIVPAGSIQLFTIPQIPKLAQGAVIPPNREFLAVLGDQKNGTNIETPLDTMVQAFRQAMAESGGGSNRGTAYLMVDRTVLGQLVYELSNAENQRVGVKLVKGRA